MNHRRGLKICSLLLVVALIFSFACAPTEKVEEPEKVIVIGTANLPDGVNPFITTGNVMFGVWGWMYDTMYELTIGDELIPDLPTKTEVSPDGKTYTITIRDNATFQDGVPLTAEDVAFTYNYIVDNELSWYAGICSPITEIKAIDDYVVEMTLKEPIGADVLNSNIFYFPQIIPKHIWQDISGDEAVGDLPLEVYIGSGPYQLVEFKRDEYLRLRVTDFGRNVLGANVDEYIIKGYADSSIMLQDLKAGDIDAVYGGVDIKSIRTLEGIPEISIAALDALVMDFVAFNSWAHAYEEGRETHPHPALKDVRVREALDWALDEKMAAEVSYGKYGTPGCQYLAFPYWKDFSHTELDCRGYDLDKAREILDEAGYLDTDGDGIRETADGQPLEFDAWASAERNPAHLDVATMWAREAEKIGIKLEVSALDRDTLWSAMNPNGDFDIGFWGWHGDPDPHFLLCTMLCEEAKEGGWSEAGYCSAEYDKMYAEAGLASTREERREIYWKMQELLYEDMPYIIYDYWGEVCAFRNDKVVMDVEVLEGLGSAGIVSKVFAITADTVS